MKKILHVLPMNKLSGAEKMALLICKNLKKHEAIVVCGGEELAEVFRRNNIKTYVLNFSNKKIISTLFRLKKIVKQSEIKLIHAHDNIASLNSYLTKKIFGLDVKVISHIHSCYPWLKYDGVNKKIDSFFRPKYDLNIVCGNLVYKFYKDNTNYFNDNKVEILSNAIDIKEIACINQSKLNITKKELNITQTKKVIGFVGRFEQMKGLVPFINELKIYKDRFIDCKFLLVGTGSLENEIKSLIKKNDLNDFFLLAGFQKDPYKFYPVIDILFLPSVYEGLPMVILEAMAFSIPVISNDVGSINEVVINNETGYLINRADLKDFINKLENLKNDNNKIINMGKNSYKKIKEYYCIEIYNEKLEKIMGEL